MQPLGPIPAEPEADVGSVVRGTENGNGVGQQLRSLAHPAWPYVGTPWEWRGFVEKVGFFAGLTEEQKTAALAYRGEENHGDARFQYLNFGPDLD